MLFQGVFIIVSHFTENINNPVGVLSHKMLPKINVAFSWERRVADVADEEDAVVRFEDIELL